jgi:hypothetical protein
MQTQARGSSSNRSGIVINIAMLPKLVRKRKERPKPPQQKPRSGGRG